MRHPSVLLALALTIPLAPGAAQASAAAPAAQPSGLTRLLAAELARFPSKSGIYVKQLATGEDAMVDPGGHYDSGSTIKVAVMVLAFQLTDQKKLDLNQRYAIKAADFRSGSGIFRYNDFDLKPTWHDIITPMIITNDNSATDIMIKRVGGVAAVNNFLRRSRYSTLKLNQTTLDYFRGRYEVVDPKYHALSPEDVFAIQGNIPNFSEPRAALIKQFKEEAAVRDQSGLLKKSQDVEESWLGVMAPREASHMIEGIESETVASKSSCREMKRILRAQESGERKMPHYLTVPVAHRGARPAASPTMSA